MKTSGRALPSILAACVAASCQGAAGGGRLPAGGGRLVDRTPPAGYPAAPLEAIAPLDSPLTEARAQLGKRLFYEPRLSATGTVACGSCHQQAHAFADPAAVSTGVADRRGTRNAPALVNLAWGATFFWDGRAPSLEDQVGLPIENPVEMDLSLPDAVARLAADAGYAQAFRDAFEGAPPSEVALRQSLASFVRTLVSGDSPYDRHLRGDDAGFSEAARRGEALFLNEKAGCFHCHPAGPLTNEGFFNNGTYESGGDGGRAALTGRPGDTGKFKVPGLRNVAASAPYMHDGSVATLDDVIDQYARGGRGDPTTDPQIAPLPLSAAESVDLVAFLNALTDASFISDPGTVP